MKNFLRIYREYLNWFTIPGTTPRLIFYKGSYKVSVYYSIDKLNAIGAEIIK